MLHLPFSRWIWILAALLFLPIGYWSTNPSSARAHAEYERSDPPADAVIPEPPAEVHVWFTQELFRREGANTLAVFGPDGEQVDKGDARIDDDDRTQMIVSLQEGLPEGVYTVRWSTLSVDDGDTDSGEFSFTVDSNAAETTPTTEAQPVEATPTPTPTPMAQPSPTPLPQAGNRLPCLGGIIFGMLALGVVVVPRRERGDG